jgi:SAM-dependent methyltransferase
LVEFYKIDGVPCNDGLMYKNLRDASNAVLGNIALQFCPHCGFVFNSEFEEEKVYYNQDYNNNQNLSESFNNYTNDLISRIKGRFSLERKKILEIACGQGDFLKKVSDAIKKVTCVGYDPSYIENEELRHYSDISINKEYFRFEEQEPKQDMIIMRHVLEHLPNPNTICTGIANNLSNNGGVMLEVPDFEWVLQQESYFDILYQHCNYFTTASLSFLLENHGFSNINCERVFDDQYLIGFANMEYEKKNVHSDFRTNIADIYKSVKNFGVEFSLYKKKWENILQNPDKRFAIWGALGKGVNFVHITDKESKHIRCAIDINKTMHGGYLPGTSVPIVSPQSIRDLDISDIIIMNPNYKSEIIEMVKNMGIELTFHDSVQK